MSFVMILSLFTGCGAKKPAEDKKNTKPAASTTVKTTKKSDKKDKITEEAASDTTTRVSASEKTTAKKKGTGKAPSNANHEKKPAPAPAVPTTAAPTTTTKPANTDTTKMEAELKEKAFAMGFKDYGNRIKYISDGGWGSTISNSDPNWQSKIEADMEYARSEGDSSIKIFFITRKNYKSQIGNGPFLNRANELDDSDFEDDNEILALVVTI